MIKKVFMIYNVSGSPMKEWKMLFTTAKPFASLLELIERGAVRFDGNDRWRRYWAVS